MPSLRQLMYFACVAEYGSIGQAAEVLHVSQPSLSRQIQALEVHIGEALFVRGPAGVSLTEVGRVVHCRAVKIIAEAKALTRDIGDGDDRQLHIGFSRYLDPGWSGKLARQLKEARVCSAVSPSWAPSLDLLSLVRESSLDAAIIGAPPKVVREYELMEIGSYEHVIALSETLHRRL
ncbi:LysR family transcriptional regulator, partial [Pseudomonas aeruginosa]